MLDFHNFIFHAGLIDCGFTGSPYIWSNNRRGQDRIWQWIDRVLTTVDRLSAFPSLQVLHLERVCSYHLSLCVPQSLGSLLHLY